MSRSRRLQQAPLHDRELGALRGVSFPYPCHRLRKPLIQSDVRISRPEIRFSLKIANRFLHRASRPHCGEGIVPGFTGMHLPSLVRKPRPSGTLPPQSKDRPCRTNGGRGSRGGGGGGPPPPPPPPPPQKKTQNHQPTPGPVPRGGGGGVGGGGGLTPLPPSPTPLIKIARIRALDPDRIRNTTIIRKGYRNMRKPVSQSCTAVIEKEGSSRSPAGGERRYSTTRFSE